jgi:sterol desaturase/sphingolipid hydroxylase (fatty acid hydroxylase superfamily)
MHPSLHRHPVAGVLLVLLVAIAVGIETLAYRRRGRAYDWAGARASVIVAVLDRGAKAATFVALEPLFGWLAGHRLCTLPLSGGAGVATAFVGVEFVYYWMHRAAHRIGWMWATHSVHHSTEQLNYFAALRLGATGLFSFEWLPFALVTWFLGTPPATIAALLALDLGYQFFLHSDLIPRIDTHQWLLNTPSDHRVHHAINAPYVDRNFGGMLIVFDRLFGTYAAERADEPPRYGLLGERRGRDPLTILFGGWRRLFVRIRAATTLGDRLRAAFGPP